MKRILPNHTIVVIGLVAVALLIRIVYIHELSNNPFFNYPVVDSATYDDMAVRIAGGDSPTDEPFFQPPFYPYFLGLLYSIFGRDFFTVRFVQMIIGVLNVVLCYEIARRISLPGLRSYPVCFSLSTARICSLKANSSLRSSLFSSINALFSVFLRIQESKRVDGP